MYVNFNINYQLSILKVLKECKIKPTNTYIFNAYMCRYSKPQLYSLVFQLFQRMCKSSFILSTEIPKFQLLWEKNVATISFLFAFLTPWKSDKLQKSIVRIFIKKKIFVMVSRTTRKSLPSRNFINRFLLPMWWKMTKNFSTKRCK